MDERVFRKTGESLGFLMRMLEDVVVESGFEPVARLLPWRQEWRDGASPSETTARFPDEIAERCVQAYSLAFQLADQAEENAMIQGLRSFEDEGRMAEESGSWEQNFRLLQSLGLDEERAAGELRALHVEPVLTAHPTEAKRQTVLEHQRTLYRALVTLENSMWTKAERARIEHEVRITIERLWADRRDLPEEAEVGGRAADGVALPVPRFSDRRAAGGRSIALGVGGFGLRSGAADRSGRAASRHLRKLGGR